LKVISGAINAVIVSKRFRALCQNKHEQSVHYNLYCRL